MKQYNSVASEPKKEYEVKDNDFFMKEESDYIHCKEEKVHEFNEDLPEDEFNSGLQLLLSDLVFSETDGSECINMLSPCSAAGPDGLPAAIHKGGSTAEPVNFRPVSLTSHLMKMMERVIRKALVGYLEYHEMMAWLQVRKINIVATPGASRPSDPGSGRRIQP